MKYMLMDYVNEAGWPQLTKAEQEHWLGAYIAYMEAMTKAGVLRSSNGLQPTSAATTVRVANGKTQVLDGPYADSKEQFGGFHIIDVADLDAAIAWAARCPTALHGVVEVRPVLDGTLLTRDPIARLRSSRQSRRRRNMRKLIVFNQVTLDGYFADANGDMSWAHKDQDPGVERICRRAMPRAEARSCSAGSPTS